MSRHRAQAHARHPHTCPCGRTVYGNGGWASHSRACRVYHLTMAESNRETIARYERILAGEEKGERLAESTYRSLLATSRARLRSLEARIAEKGWA